MNSFKSFLLPIFSATALLITSHAVASPIASTDIWGVTTHHITNGGSLNQKAPGNTNLNQTSKPTNAQ